MNHSLPFIGVDIDGVLCDLYPAFLRLLGEHHGLHATVDDMVAYQFGESIGATEFMVRDTFRRVQRLRHEELPPYDGAIEGIASLRSVGTIWHITARSRQWGAQTAEWLEHNAMTGEALVFSSDKAAFARRKRLDLMIEDCYETTVKMIGVGVPCILMDRPWNRYENIPGLHRVSTWPEAVEAARQILKGR